MASARGETHQGPLLGIRQKAHRQEPGVVQPCGRVRARHQRPRAPRQHPPSRTLSQRQIEEIHAIERRYDGVVRWGGDWSDPDPMHWEVVGTPAQCARVVAKLKGQPELRRGSRGGHVLKAQRILNAVPGTGPDIKADGIFGPDTESKTRRVQRHGDLADDGIIGPRTWAYLERWA